jgi:demethylmenaquinone methyltransferase/2-methoxy-6-polyprenyl-1,4-benzoquinol methylase
MPDPVAVSSMFGRIAPRYDVANHVLSLGLDFGWRRKLVRAVKRHSPHDILDLATGSGDVAFALSRELPGGTKIVGMDFCRPMLDQANLKKSREPEARKPDLTFREGDGMNLPLADASFDAVTISFGLRNMADRHRSLREMRRVLRPGGHVFVLEFTQPPAWLKPFYFFYLRKILPRIAGAITGDHDAYVYLHDSIEQFPNRAELAAEISAAGFADVTAHSLGGGTVGLFEGRR